MNDSKGALDLLTPCKVQDLGFTLHHIRVRVDLCSSESNIVKEL